MNRLATLAMTTVSLLFVGVALLAGDGIGYAQQRSDSDNVKAAVDAFHAALSNLDIGKMQDVWAQEPYAVLINPRDKAPAIELGTHSHDNGQALQPRGLPQPHAGGAGLVLAAKVSLIGRGSALDTRKATSIRAFDTTCRSFS